MEIDGARVASTSAVTGGLHGDIVQAGQDDVLPTTDGLNNARGAVELTAGPHRLRVRVIADVSGAPVQVRLNWVTPEEQAANYAEAIAAAKSAKTAVVFAWSRDKPAFHLPGDQDQFIAAIADANPNTVVVLKTSQPVAMPWLRKVKGVVQMWWPGDEGGWATADVLSGRKNPPVVCPSPGRTDWRTTPRMIRRIPNGPAETARRSSARAWMSATVGSTGPARRRSIRSVSA